MTSRVATAAEEAAQMEEVGALTLKGLGRPVPTFSVGAARP